MMCLGLVELALNTKRCSDWDYAKREGTQELLGSTRGGRRRNGTQPPLLPAGMDQRLVQGCAAQQGLRRTRQRRRHARLEGDQDEADRNGPQIRRRDPSCRLRRTIPLTTYATWPPCRPRGVLQLATGDSLRHFPQLSRHVATCADPANAKRSLPCFRAEKILPNSENILADRA